MFDSARYGTYKRETYLGSVIAKIGRECPCCGRTLQVSPTKIEVSAPKQQLVLQEKKRTLPPALREVLNLLALWV